MIAGDFSVNAHFFPVRGPCSSSPLALARPPSLVVSLLEPSPIRFRLLSGSPASWSLQILALTISRWQKPLTSTSQPLHSATQTPLWDMLTSPSHATTRYERETNHFLQVVFVQCGLRFKCCVLGSPLCGFDVVDVVQRGAEDEGHHLQGAPMGGHAWSVFLQRSWGGIDRFSHPRIQNLSENFTFVHPVLGKHMHLPF